MNNIVKIIIIIVSILLICGILWSLRLVPQYMMCSRLFDCYKGIPACNECGERLNILKHLQSNDVVLEIGGNIGSSSFVIADKILNPESNLVVVEPSKSAAKKLAQNQKKNKLNFHIFQGIVGTEENKNVNELYAKEWGKMGYVTFVNTPKPGSYKVDTKTIDELESMYNIKFNTLVIDCEGCYKALFNSDNFLKKFNKILIEWDGPFMEKYLIEKGFKKIDQWAHPFLIHGISYYKR